MIDALPQLGLLLVRPGMLILTAPSDGAASPSSPVAPPTPVSFAQPILHEPILQGPVVDPEGNPDVVKGQSEVDDLLASLGF